MPTATLTLTRVCVTLAGNQPLGTTGVRGGSAGSIGGGGNRVESRESEGEFRQYANGTTRLVTGSGFTRSQNFALRALTKADVKTLRSMAGKTCLFRDTYGTKFYGSFLVLDEVTIPFSGTGGSGTLADVALQVTEVSYTEGL